MASAKVYSAEGTEQGSVELPDGIFDVEPNVFLVHSVAKALMNARRQGNHKTKVRSEVRGGGAKPYRQKGTGRARRGSSREPLLRGGGTVFGPQPRSYREKTPTRFKRQALCCVLSDRVRNERFSVLKELSIEVPKTKTFAQLVAKLAPEGRKTLIVTADNDKNLYLSTRNMPRVNVCTAADVNVLDVLDAVRVVVQEEALAKLQERLS
jgi:large subunit ribosomal protein L4